MIFLWQRENKDSKWAGVQEIAKAIDSPVAFTSKILQQLTKAELIISMRGPSGGFSKLDQGEVSLIDIVHAIDGKKITHKCILGFGSCSEKHPCALHFRFMEIRQNLNKVLSESTMHEMAELVGAGIVYLK